MRTLFDEFKAGGGLTTIVPGQPDDLLLVAYSFEPRSLAVVECLSDSYEANLGVIYNNQEIVSIENGGPPISSYDELRFGIAARCREVRQAQGSLVRPGVQLETFTKIFTRRGFDRESVRSITLDATSFNRETLLMLLGIIEFAFPKARIRVFYVSPVTYGDWLSAGFKQVRNVIGLAGLQIPGRKTLLVLLYGFEHQRALKAIEEYEPAKVLLGFGGTPTEIEFLKRNLEELDKVQKKLVLSQQEVMEFEFRADSIAHCAKQLEEVIRRELDSYNVVMAPMSTKLSTIATYVVARKHPQIQVAYCVPGEYNTQSYSDGTKSVFTEELTLS
ncbi:hypothetical protein [Aquisphaera insulae]|uniref:hypothetical protein n=1 Tax=Aquisphaera insulae TaxID=2712864 RepID=UPI0013EC8647|nr:hypothetical protein [Aquisphaera insulae]